MIEILNQLFIQWKLDTWANVLEVFGFVISSFALLIGIFIKSELNKLKTDILFNKRVSKHLKHLKDNSANINNFLNSYNNNHNEIKNEFGLCRTELQDLSEKITRRESKKSRKLARLLNRLQSNNFEINTGNSTSLNFISKQIKRLNTTTVDDVWEIYAKLQEVIRQIENLKENKAKSK